MSRVHDALRRAEKGGFLGPDEPPVHTVVLTSLSPAEGNTFIAVNLALAQSQLAENSVLLGDFDLRRPIIHNLFQIDRAPGLSDFLTGQCTFAQAIRRIDGMNLYL